MSKYIKTVLNRPIAVVVSVIALILFGVSSMTGMSLELYPQTSYPMLFVSTMYPQAGPEEVERLITQKIEESCGTISGLKQMSSTSSEGMSEVTFQFAYGTDIGEARTQLQEALEDAKIEFPDGVQSPTIVSMNNNSDAAISISVESEKDIDVRSLVKQQIVPELKKIGDAAAVKWYGGNEKYISIELRPELAAQYNLDISTIADAISSANTEVAGGQVAYGNQNLSVSTAARYTDIEALKNPNSPKIVVDHQGYAMYFSRSVIPFIRGKEEENWIGSYPFLKHIGLYAYRADVLKEVTKLPQSSLELAESLEQLRWLQNGYRIKVGLTDVETIGIDTPEDLQKAEEFLLKVNG